MKGAKWLFRCLLVIGCVVLITAHGYAQNTTVREKFGAIIDGSGNYTEISVMDGNKLILFSTDKRTINRVLMQLPKAEANQLVGAVEKAHADLSNPPVKLANNQTIDKEFATIFRGSAIVVKVTRNSSGTFLKVNNYDSSMINKVYLELYERQAKQYLEALQKAVKSMK
jgi:hypothetical protein